MLIYTFKVLAVYGVYGWFEGQADGIVVVFVEV